MDYKDELREYEREQQPEFLIRAKWLLLYISPTINLIYIPLDRLLAEADFRFLLIGRLAMVVGSLACVPLIKEGRFTRGFAMLVLTGHSVCIGYMSTVFGSFLNFYLLNGPSTISIACSFLFLNNWRDVFIANILIYSTVYFTAVSVLGMPSLYDALNYWFTFVAFTLISCVLTRAIGIIKLSEFRTRRKLSLEISQRDIIIADKVSQVLSASDQIKRIDAQLESTKQLSNLAARVAHDIRSPLTALGIVASSLDGFPEIHRTLARSALSRINDIANSLLDYRKQNLQTQNATNSVFALGPFLDRLISEKRMENSGKQNIKIIFQDSEVQFNTFVDASAVELARHLSNLMNNAVDSIRGTGAVEVSIEKSGSLIAIVIQDNGKGIPQETLKQLGHQEISVGKSHGHGLGVYHAQSFFKSINGDLKILSELGVGTKVTAYLRQTETPKWACKSLVIRNKNIVVIDDDTTICEVWRKKLRSQASTTFLVDPRNFEANLKQIAKVETLFLIDYEFRNTQTDGLRLIDSHGISGVSVLVTSRFEDPDIIKAASALGVQVLAKNWIQFIPVY